MDSQRLADLIDAALADGIGGAALRVLLRVLRAGGGPVALPWATTAAGLGIAPVTLKQTIRRLVDSGWLARSARGVYGPGYKAGTDSPPIRQGMPGESLGGSPPIPRGFTANPSTDSPATPNGFTGNPSGGSPAIPCPPPYPPIKNPELASKPAGAGSPEESRKVDDSPTPGQPAGWYELSHGAAVDSGGKVTSRDLWSGWTSRADVRAAWGQFPDVEVWRDALREMARVGKVDHPIPYLLEVVRKRGPALRGAPPDKPPVIPPEYLPFKREPERVLTPEQVAARDAWIADWKKRHPRPIDTGLNARAAARRRQQA